MSSNRQRPDPDASYLPTFKDQVRSAARERGRNEDAGAPRASDQDDAHLDLPTFKDQVRPAGKERGSNEDAGAPRASDQDDAHVVTAEAVPIDDVSRQPGPAPIALVEPASSTHASTASPIRQASHHSSSRASTSRSSRSGKRSGRTFQSTSDTDNISTLGNSGYTSSNNKSHRKHWIWAGVVVIAIVVAGGVAGYVLSARGSNNQGSVDSNAANQPPSVSPPPGVPVAPPAPEAPVQTTPPAPPAPSAFTTAAPAPTPAGTPVAPPTDAPVANPVAPPTNVPVAVPVAPPTDAPVANPVAPPTDAPTANPVAPEALVEFETTALEGESGGDNFGTFVVFSRDGSTLAVGASDGSYVKVYSVNAGQRTLQQIGATLRGSGNFGKCLALSADGSVLAVGAWNNDDAGTNAGKVDVYENQGGAWESMGSSLVGDEADDRFGWYVGLSDDGLTLAVSGRLGDPSDGLVDAGYIRAYQYNGGQNQWNSLGNDLIGESPGEQFGRSLALSADGSRLVAGAVSGGENGGGRIRVFDYSNGVWTQVGQNLDGEATDDWQGTSVAISASGAVIGIAADGHDANGSNSGMVRVYELTDNGGSPSEWNQMGNNILGEGAGDQFGAGHISLSSDGHCLTVGGNDEQNGGRGKGYLYRWLDSTQEWVLAASITGENNNDGLGDSSTVSGDCSLVAFGAVQDADPGYVRVFSVQ